jgi:uncharacterized membrane protein YkgB
MDTHTLDLKLLHWCRTISIPLARFAIFVVFFWFGLLKVLGLSPASELVGKLFESTIPYMSFDTFLIGFGLFEMLIGLMFLIRGLERLVIPLLFLHMVTTFMPLFVLPSETWSGFLVPTLTGQYIIKNVVLIACAVGIAAHLHPMRMRNSHS